MTLKRYLCLEKVAVARSLRSGIGLMAIYIVLRWLNLAGGINKKIKKSRERLIYRADCKTSMWSGTLMHG